jgi:hypothetical protein
MLLSPAAASGTKVTLEMANALLEAVGAAGVRASALGRILRTASAGPQKSAAARALPGAGALARRLAIPEWAKAGASATLILGTFALDVYTGASVKEATASTVGGTIGAYGGRVVGGLVCGAAGVATDGGGLFLCGGAIAAGSFAGAYVGSQLAVAVSKWF